MNKSNLCSKLHVVSENKKSNVNADEIRIEGNKYYADKRFFDALISYNKSLCYAESDTETVGLAYANRSAVYFECQLFEKCLGNIQLAKDNKYPEKNFEILNKREEKCKQQKKMPENNPWDIFKLSYKPHKKIPYIAECLELNSHKKFGRFITTNRALKVGDIIAIEEPYCVVLLPESQRYSISDTNKYQRCSYCLKDNSLDLVPCHGCIYTMFCSNECRDKAVEKYHKYDCVIMESLQGSASLLIAPRLLFMALSTFDDSIEKLEEFLSNYEDSTATVFDFDFSNPENPDNARNLLLAAYCLCRSNKQFPLDAQENILKGHPVLKDTFKTHEKFIRKFFLRQAQICDSSIHGIFAHSLKKQDLTNMNSIAAFNLLQETTGSGCFPFAALLNHSCAPNAMRTNIDGKVAIVMIRPVTAGAQIFDSYSANFNTQIRSERQSKLLREFYFECECEACTLNYEAPPALKTYDIKVQRYAKKIEDDLMHLKPNQAKKKYRDICEAIVKSSPHFPCCEITLLQRCMVLFYLFAAKPAFQFA